MNRKILFEQYTRSLAVSHEALIAERAKLLDRTAIDARVAEIDAQLNDLRQALESAVPELSELTGEKLDVVEVRRRYGYMALPGGTRLPVDLIREGEDEFGRTPMKPLPAEEAVPLPKNGPPVNTETKKEGVGK